MSPCSAAGGEGGGGAPPPPPDTALRVDMVGVHSVFRGYGRTLRVITEPGYL